MQIEMVPLSSLKPYPGNPRINDEAVDQVAKSIREFGFRQPIVVDESGTIICGHTRYKAAVQLELETVPVHRVKDLTPEQIRSYRLADNRAAELSHWDYDLLPIELHELKQANVELTILGWDTKTLEALLLPTKEQDAPWEGDAIDEDISDEVPSVTCPKCGEIIPK